MIKRDEAVRRIVERDNRTAEEAAKRLEAQMTNAEVVDASNVVFCTQWSGEFTQKQVVKAWDNLQKRLL